MNATEMRKIAIEAAKEEIKDIENAILTVSKEKGTFLKLNGMSGGAIAYFIENGYIIDRTDHGIGGDRTITMIKINWERE